MYQHWGVTENGFAYQKIIFTLTCAQFQRAWFHDRPLLRWV